MKIEGLTFSYGNNVIFEKVSFETNSKIAVLTGPSGCGKTTFLKIAAGWATPSTISMDYNTKGTLLVIQEDAFLPWLSGIVYIMERLTTLFRAILTTGLADFGLQQIL